MPKITDDHRAKRRRQIASAAIRCFARKGFEGTSMADIIAESGLSAGAIYLHYKNKQDLVRFVVSDVLEGRSNDLTVMAALDPLPAPAVVIRTFVAGMTSELGGADILVQVWSISAREPVLAELITSFIAELRRLWVQYFTAWFTTQGFGADGATERAVALAPVLVGICQGYVLQAAIVPGFEPERYLRAVDLIDFAAVPDDPASLAR